MNNNFNVPRPPKGTFLVFVYGSLLRGLHNNRMLQGHQAEFVRRDSIRARLFTAHWGWPFMVFSQSSKNRLLGEVYRVTGDKFYHLDSLEGYRPNRDPNQCLFIRKRAHTKSGLKVYVYEGGKSLKMSRCHEILSGPKGINWRSIKCLIKMYSKVDKIPATISPVASPYSLRDDAVGRLITEGRVIERPSAPREGIILKPKSVWSVKPTSTIIKIKKSDNVGFTGTIEIKKTPGCDLKNAMADQISGNTPHPF